MNYQIKFRGIDRFGRPIYKVVDKAMYFGSTETLFSYNADEETVNKHFKNNTQELEYFGNHFDCEPHGGRPENLTLTII